MRRSPRVLITALILSLTGAAFAIPAQQAEAKPEPKDRVRVIVELKQRAKQDDVIAATGKQATKVKKTKTMPFVIMEVPRNALKGLRNNPHVRGVHEDRADRLTLDASVPVINGDDVHTLGFSGTGATVAVLDTGIDSDHPFYAGRVLAQQCFSTTGANSVSLCPDGADQDDSADIDDNLGTNCMDGAVNLCDHGTHVAGIAVGSGAAAGSPGNGVAPGARLIGVQVFSRFNDDSQCGGAAGDAPCVKSFAADQVLAMDWVRDQAIANPTWNVVSANMSLGTGMFASACDAHAQEAGRTTAIQLLLNAGVATVISSGNDSHLNAVGMPSCISTAFTVGRTDNSDGTSNSGNRGPLLDVMAPGSGITSSVPDDAYGNMSGTSMSAPHVAGALAVLRAAQPTRSITDLLNDITSTGVPITYTTNAAGTTSNTTPRLNLLAALQNADAPPVVTVANPTVTVDEGTTATNSGTVTDNGTIASMTATLGTVNRSGDTWSWSYPAVNGFWEGDVTITATDNTGLTGSATFHLVINNVAPTVTMDPIAAAVEGDTVTVTASFTDPGVNDTHTATVKWDGEAPVAATVTGNTVSASRQIGDDWEVPVTITVTDDDGDSGDDTENLVVSNANPTAEITGPATTSWNGMDIIFAEAGTPITFTGHSNDPGSDDLTFDWTFGDGGTDSNVHLNDPPATDPDPSIQVNPRSVNDDSTHTYALACARELGLKVTDDDAGSATDTAQVIVLGTSSDAGTLGVWQTDFREKRSKLHTVAQKECLLSVVRLLSSEFSEVKAINTIAQATAALYPKGTKNPNDQFDAHLLALWLNIADGSISLTDPVDSNGDGTADTTVGALIQAAEAERTSANPSESALTNYKNLFEAINAAN